MDRSQEGEKLSSTTSAIDAALEKVYGGRRCLLAGGAGMLGSYVAERLAALGAEPLVVDDLSAGRAEWLCLAPHDCEPSQGRIGLRVLDLISDYEVFSCTLATFQPDYLFNFAAKVEGMTYNERAHADMCIENTLLSILPLRACARRRSTPLRFVQLSTACVYPHDATIPTPESQGLRGEPELTNSGYGWAKRLGERAAYWAAAEWPWLRPIVVRPSNLYSPRERFSNPHAHVIPRLTYLFLAAARGERIPVRGAGAARRSFLHARDASVGLLLAAATSWMGPMNLAASQSCEVTISELVAKIAAICMSMTDGAAGAAIPEWLSNADEGYTRRLSDGSLLVEYLRHAGLPAWRPETELNDGLREVVEACMAFLARERAPLSRTGH